MPKFEPADYNQFTHVLGPCRHFDIAIMHGLLRELSRYSAIPAEVQALMVAGRKVPLAKLGRTWLLVPLTPGAQNAGELLYQLCQDPRATVLASHSVILPFRVPTARFLFVGGPEAAEICAPREGSPFAVIVRPGARPIAQPVVETQAEAAPAPESPKVEAPAPAPTPAPGPSKFQEIRNGKVVETVDMHMTGDTHPPVVVDSHDQVPPSSPTLNGHSKKAWTKPEVADLPTPPEGAPSP